MLTAFEGQVSDSGEGRWTIHAAIALSGASALGAEVVWTRLMGLMLGATVYAFSIILAVFLVGLAIGTASHGIGTARALQVNEVAGAFSGLAMGLNALATAVSIARKIAKVPPLHFPAAYA